MDIPSKYNPAETEDKWYGFWMENKLFHSEPDEREPYCIVIPPPNVTGVLHMGHILNNTLQDVLVRRARMLGKNALWLPGTDHASIATEAKVVNKLREEGIKKSEIGREEFLKHAWEWKEKHGGIILEQLKKLGASCDWDRTRFTMDEALYDSVIDVFIDLYNKGLIYRGVRMVNWDPKALTALSDEEVIHKEVQSKLYYVRYPIEGEEEEFVTIATTRPETILGDTAVCINPNDERFKHLKGKKVIVPLVNRPVPIIEDEYVDMEFGTGCLKITPAHDPNDYEIGIRHKLDSFDIFNDNGSMSEEAGLYIGEDRFKARALAVKDLKQNGQLAKVEDYVNKIGFSERTDEVIEPKLSLQWFLRMPELARPALEVVMNDTVNFVPRKFKNTYRHWMENVHDWCISRQLWWGQRIPVYYLPNREMVVAKSLDEAYEKALAQFPELKDLKKEDIKQDEDVLDTWFSSWLWPISVFDGIRHPDNRDINYYYPTDDLITAPEILFFWVARMIMAGLEYRNETPFKNVYLTGIVRDKLGRKMSKSLGNSPDPIELMNKHGADGVRVGMLLTSPAGNDLPFDEALCEQGRNFSNKIWNALRLVKGWEVDETLDQSKVNAVSIEWFETRLNRALKTIDDHYSKYRISDALMAIYKLVWDEFCSWYLEMIKPAYQKPIDRKTLSKTIELFDRLMRVLHPFMPFLTEEIWHRLKERKENESIMLATMPEKGRVDHKLLDLFEYVREVIIAVRNVRKQKNIPFKEQIELFIKKNHVKTPNLDTKFDGVVSKLCNLSGISYTDQKKDNAVSFIVRSTEFYIPLTENVDVEAEIKKLEEELKYTKGFLNTVMKKLSNERFVNNAPEAVVAKERKKQEDAETRIRVLEEQIEGLSK
ncbi:MAG: valine--tRNA ligase [Bacteroidales bacterium]|nr:valine--tRNA ligase [Bacteroidales bacterium]MCF8343758.1 valine--tRNA ligase [Bacteroidales bacterium]MCF8352367.1 valine--tRNA ligase [Bacteroidales bacterium]MCF8377851.1 valine--tRNA ligase [Bacteroidales bacterium]